MKHRGCGASDQTGVSQVPEEIRDYRTHSGVVIRYVSIIQSQTLFCHPGMKGLIPRKCRCCTYQDTEHGQYNEDHPCAQPLLHFNPPFRNAENQQAAEMEETTDGFIISQQNTALLGVRSAHFEAYEHDQPLSLPRGLMVGTI